VNERYRAGDIRHCYADTSLAEELLGFRARVSLEQGMSELISWLAHQEADDRVAAATGELAAWGLTR
jgi:dTDP-L-rhamnose 4-epimerase